MGRWRSRPESLGGQERHRNQKPQNTTLVTGEHWTGSRKKSIDQIGKNSQKMSENRVFGPSGQLVINNFRTFFRHFSDILSAFRSSGLSSDLPVTTLPKKQQTEVYPYHLGAGSRDQIQQRALQAQKSGSFARGRCRRGRSEIPHFCSKLLLFALVL